MAGINNNMSMSQKYGTPSPDPGASFGEQNVTDQDTSGIFIGSSKDKATRWTIHRGAGQGVNAAYAGKGAISFDDDQSYKPVDSLG